MSGPLPAVGRQGLCAGGCCTTKRQNTHIIDRREVLYRWHPWFGRSVYVDEVIDKLGDAVFRCKLTGDLSDRSLEVPIWMFDRTACAACRRADTAHVGLEALRALAELVCDAGTSVDISGSPSRVGAALDSEHEIRRLANATQNNEYATRAFPGQPVYARDPNSAMAKPSRRHATSADAVDGATDDGTYGRGK